MNEDLSFFKLLEYVRFEYVSSATMLSFCTIVSEHIDCLNISIWSSLCVRLTTDISPINHNSRLIEIEFIPKSSTPLEGIICYLTGKHGGNVHDRGIVKITSTEPYDDTSRHAAKNAADLTSESYFFSKNIPNPWFCYDFVDCRIKPTHYSIRTPNGGADNHYPKSWVIETSIDESTWIEIDRYENDISLKGGNLTGLFKVSRIEECRFVRFRQIGKTHYSSPTDYLVFSGLEIFGYFTEV
jgi:hypothetical protein